MRINKQEIQESPRYQCADSIMMVRPKHFGYNLETASSNVYQKTIPGATVDQIQILGREEFDTVVEKLKDYRIDVMVVEDNDVVKTDAVFSNNWISLHEDGMVITYPLESPNRRLERREDIIDQLEESFVIEKRYSFDFFENQDLFLEGTGSLVLDRINKIAYCCLSSRTNIKIAEKFAVLAGYEKIIFHAFDENGSPIYHTNVLMCIGATFCIICMDAIPSQEEKNQLYKLFDNTKKEIIEISQDQVKAFAGNMLQVRNLDGEPILIMSKTAFESLEPEQILGIRKHTEFLYVSIPTIEQIGGGSIRCMITENFLPKK